jgi:molecular chaperone HscB
MNYFQFYDLPVSFFPDETALKKKFHQFSRQFHPDFYTLESPERQSEVLELSARNTAAYKTLTDADARMKYILELHDVWGDEGSQKLPNSFLADMMDINEALMELEFDFDKTQFTLIEKNIQTLDNELLTEIEPVLKRYSFETPDLEDLKKVKIFYLKKRYLLRITENLIKFATL